MKRGFGLLVLATILWGGNFIAGRFLAAAMPATLLNTVRWAISTVILFGLLKLNKKPVPIVAKWREFLILGFLGIFAFSTLNYMGLREIPASQAGMISAGTPVAILMFTLWVLKERIKGKAWLGTVVSILGVVLLFLGKHTQASHSSLLGEFEMVLASLTWGLYTVLGKKYGKQMDPLTMTAGASFYGTIFSALSCIGTVQASMIHMTPSAWLAVLYISTLASVVAFYAWNAGVKLVGAGKAAPYLNLLPVWTVVFGVLLLSEHVSGTSLTGGMITIVGAILATL